MFNQQLLLNGEDSALVTFKVDTFRIEHFQLKYLGYDYSNAGMQQAVYSAADKYDTLLNRYYQKLLVLIGKEDKNTLILAQRTWLLFRANEMKLVQLLSDEKYSGGGTMQQLVFAEYYLDLIRERTCNLFQHYAMISTMH